MNYNEMTELKLRHGILIKNKKSRKENKILIKQLKSEGVLPEGIYQDQLNGNTFNEFYTITENVSNEDFDQYVKLKQLDYIKRIINILSFFVVVTVITILINLFN